MYALLHSLQLILYTNLHKCSFRDLSFSLTQICYRVLNGFRSSGIDQRQLQRTILLQNCVRAMSKKAKAPLYTSEVIALLHCLKILLSSLDTPDIRCPHWSRLLTCIYVLVGILLSVRLGVYDQVDCPIGSSHMFQCLPDVRLLLLVVSLFFHHTPCPVVQFA